uniref:Uncharacterized protein n=1 Tax=Cyanothece sp. (strain PCC 7425 / ATCC 29141) TaxID=395961 RepID=B8HTB4_CYAP4
MKIVEQSAERLRISTGNGPTLTKLVWSLVFVGVGSTLLWITGQVQFHCERLEPQQVSCKLQKRNWFAYPLRSESIAQLQGARVHETDSDDGSMYKVILQTAQGEIPFTNYGSSGYTEKAEIADRINRFIQDQSQTYLSLSAANWPEGVGLGLGGVILALSCLTLYGMALGSGHPGTINTLTFDKLQGRLMVDTGSLLRPQRVDYSLLEIQSISLAISERLTTAIRLQLTSGHALDLGQLLAGASMAKTRPIAHQLSQFLGKPWQLAIAPTLDWGLQNYSTLAKNIYTKIAEKSNLSVNLATWIFNPQTRQFSSEQEQRKLASYNWQDISEITIQPIRPGATGKPSSTLPYQLVLRLNSGESLVLQEYVGESEGDSAQTQAETVAKYLRDYLQR